MPFYKPQCLPLAYFVPFFSFSFFFLVFPFPFCRTPLSCSVSSFRFPYASCITFFGFFSLPCSPWGQIIFVCLGATPPRAAFEPANRRIILACASFLACYVFMFFFSSLPFSISIWTSSYFILPFSFGYCVVSSFSVATRSAYRRYLISTYADLTFYFCLRYKICFSYRFITLGFIFSS